MAAEIERKDIISDDAIKAPLDLSKNMQTLVAEMDKYAATAKKIITTSDAESKSLVKLGDESKKIVKLNQDFAKTQEELTIQVKKSTDEQAKQQKQLNETAKSTTKYSNEMQRLKKEVKDTESELVKLARTNGTNSKQFQEAALKAGQLKDEMEDIRDAIKNTSASPFENVATQLGNVGGKLKGLDFGGAKAAAEQLATSSKGITFKEAIGGLKDFGSTLATAGKAILTNPLFLLTAIILGIAVAVYKLRNSIPGLKLAFDAVGKSMDYVVQQGKNFLDFIGLTTFALDDLAKKEKEMTEGRIKGTTEMYDHQIKLAEIAGKETADLEKKKWEEIKRIADEGFKATIDSNGNIRSADLEDAKKFIQESAKATRELEKINLYEKIHAAQVARFALLKESEKLRHDIKIVATSGVADEIGIHGLSFRALEKHLAKKVEATKFTYAQLQKIRYDDLKKLEGDVAEALAIEQSLVGGVKALNDDLSIYRMQRIEEERLALDEKHKEDIVKVGDNKRALLMVERNYQAELDQINKKALEEKQRMARFDKAAAFLEASLKEALLIIEALALPTPRNIAAAIGGGLQVAAIAAKPIPKYAKGRNNGPAETAIINEEGNELIMGTDGSARMYDTDGAVLTTLKAGEKVLTAAETDALIGSGLRNVSPSSIAERKKSNALLAEITGLRSDIRKKKTLEINFSRDGVEALFKNAESRRRILNDFYA